MEQTNIQVATAQEESKEQQHMPNEQGFLMFVAENSGIRPDDLEKLFYNGFDNPESFSMVTADELQALGTEEDPIDLSDKIAATMEVYRDYVAQHGAYPTGWQADIDAREANQEQHDQSYNHIFFHVTTICFAI